ncbi:MAG: hypothetical protein GY869_17915, partial [Planctomycetes bacterium]|nr:hypothetical protein [Planctomycetota bacterium]
MPNFRQVLSLILLFIFQTSLIFADVTWTPIGPGGGSDLISVAIQPDNSDIMYVAGDIEGVFKTTDGGQTWTIMNNGRRAGDLPGGVYGIQELVIDPNDYQTIYACTWAGLFKSTNGALDWSLVFPPEIEDEGIPVSYLAVDPVNSQIIYWGIGNADPNEDGTGQLYRSIDGGQSWNLLTTGMSGETVIHSILIDPTSPAANRRIFVSTNNGVYRSLDNGLIWAEANTDLPHLNTRRLIGRTVGKSFVIFLSLHSEGDPTDPGSFQGGLCKSTNGADTWVSINGDLPPVPYEDPEEPPPFYDYWKYDVHPLDPDIIYVGTNFGGWGDLDGVHKTTNGGQHWEHVFTNMEYGWLDDVWWNDDNITYLAIAPGQPDVVYAGNDCVYKTIDAGSSWQQEYTDMITIPGNQPSTFWQTRGMELMVVFDIDFDLTDPNRMYVSYDDMGPWRSDDGGNSFAPLDPVQNGDYDCAASLVVDPFNGDVYLGRNMGTEDIDIGFTRGQVLKSTDHGLTWTVFDDIPEGFPKLALDTTSPVGQRVLYCTVYGQGVYKTTNSGNTWQQINNGLGVNAGYAWALDIGLSDPQTLYLGLNSLVGNGNGGVYKSTNGGQSWSALSGASGIDVLS